MLAVIFEFEPAEGRFEEYRRHAQALRRELETIDGFISIERFESLSRPGCYLSLSFWRDEQAIANWRNLHSHRAAQGKGRDGLFDNYRLRVAEVARDYGLHERDQAPADSRAAHAED